VDSLRSALHPRDRPRSIHSKHTRICVPLLHRRCWYTKYCLEGASFANCCPAYPDGHPDSTNDEGTEIANLKAKVDAGADFIITQLFYDTDRFLNWVKKVRATGALFNLILVKRRPLTFGTGITVPIIPGIMPIQTYATFARLTKLCGTKVPKRLEEDLLPLKVSKASDE